MNEAIGLLDGPPGELPVLGKGRVLEREASADGDGLRGSLSVLRLRLGWGRTHADRQH
jgi:hypothetical protein